MYTNHHRLHRQPTNSNDTNITQRRAGQTAHRLMGKLNGIGI